MTDKQLEAAAINESSLGETIEILRKNIEEHPYSVEIMFKAKHLRSLLDGIENVIARCNGYSEMVADLKRSIDFWQTWFYESEEENCSCNIVDDPALYVVCDYHRDMGRVVARDQVITLAMRAEVAEAKLAALLEEKSMTTALYKQIEAAAEAMQIEVSKRMGTTYNYRNDSYLDLARAAYPHLAVWEEPTVAEAAEFFEMYMASKGHSSDGFRDTFQEFVRRRNAALLPVDPQPIKEATVPEINVPEGMLKEAQGVIGHLVSPLEVRKALEAALRWLLAEIEKLRRPGDIGRAVALDDVRRMFVPPVDPRREKIIAVLRKSRIYVANAESGDLETVAGNILSALEEK